MLYLDYCATTPPYEEVVQTMTDVLREQYGNPSSLHRIGLHAERLLAKAREVTASAVGGKPGEIVFTAGGTEANNLAIKGAALRYRDRGRHIIISQIEHASVYESAKSLEREGWEVSFIRADRSGAVNAEQLLAAIRNDTVLVSLMHVNNETGRIQPVAEVGRLLKSYPKIVFHVDAVQSIGKLDIVPARLGADLLTGSAHKLRGPKGAGFLYVRDGVELAPLLEGGGQERGFRSGTENVPAIVGMAKALRMTIERREESLARLRKLRERLVERLQPIEGVNLTGSHDAAGMAPQLVHMTVPGLRAEAVVHALEEKGICISTRSACASGETEPSRVLLAMGYNEQEAATGLRVSYSADQTEADIDYFCSAFAEVVARHRATAGAANLRWRSTV